MTNTNLTQIELEGLLFDFNLGDAHTHQSQSTTQALIVRGLPDIFRVASQTKQHELNAAVIEAYHNLVEQRTAVRTGRNLLCYSSSMAMEVLANLARQCQWKIMLIEPTFDNIADILKRHNVSLLPLDERLLITSLDLLFTYLNNHYFHVLFLTLPNNPSGIYLSKQDFTVLVNYCKKKGIILVLDTTFRAYEPGMLYDQYAILEESNIDYVVIEDTGKIWPTLDLKIGFLNSSAGLFDDLAVIHSDFLLNVSPFILQLVQEYCRDSRNDYFRSVRNLILDNRKTLRSSVQGTILTPFFLDSNVSVEFLLINSSVNSKTIHDVLASNGIYVLPGNKFFWNSPHLGDKFLRVALARDTELFQQAVTRMVTILQERFSVCA